jgi:eukaryotic-like serine/threonine-protein kinase
MSDPFTLISTFDPQAHVAAVPTLTLPSLECFPELTRMQPGHQFGRYRVERYLGEGGMGAVYLCHDPVLARWVAVKAAQPSCNDVNSGLRFLREAEVLARLQHPHVVAVFDVGMQGTVPFIVLEFIEGSNLRSLLDAKKRLPLPLAVNLLLPLCSAIGYAHRKNVLHLDLKPSNVLLSSDHVGRTFPKVLDFGVCVLSDVDSELDPTRSEFAGTPAYCAPEAIRRQGVSDKTDQFALGVMLFEALSGTNPFAQCSTLSETLLLIEQHRYQPLSAVAPNLPAQVSDVVQRAMDPNPKLRFPSVDDFARAIVAASGVNDVTAWDSSLPPSSRL